MKATHTDQLDLLELQKLDQKESALRHKRDSHPAHATVREFAGRVADLQRAAITQSALIADTTREVTRIEDEIAKVSERRKRQQSRIDNNPGAPARHFRHGTRDRPDGSPPGQARKRPGGR